MLSITRKIYDNIYYDECFILWFIIYNNFNESLRIIFMIKYIIYIWEIKIYGKVYKIYILKRYIRYRIL